MLYFSNLHMFCSISDVDEWRLRKFVNWPSLFLCFSGTAVWKINSRAGGGASDSGYSAGAMQTGIWDRWQHEQYQVILMYCVGVCRGYLMLQQVSVMRPCCLKNVIVRLRKRWQYSWLLCAGIRMEFLQCQLVLWFTYSTMSLYV